MTAPTVPDYSGSSDPTGTPTTTTNPLDVWHLGNYYGQPIGVGIVPGHTGPVSPNGQDLTPGKTNSTPTHIDYRQTQDYVKKVAELWAQATAGGGDQNAMQQYVGLQNALFNAGAYGSTAYNSIRWGSWQGTEQALVKAISDYEDFVSGSGLPMTFDDYLASHRTGGIATGVLNPNGTGATGSGQSAPQVNLTDPTEIRAAAQQAAQASLGHTFTPKQLDAFVNQFHAAQTAAQTSTDASVTTPDLSSEALAEAQSGPNAQEFANHQAQGYMDTFIDMFAPSGSQSGGVRPVTPVV